MYIAKYFSTSKSIDLFQKYRLPLLTLAGMTASLLTSQSAYAAVNNPGAICQSDSYQDRLTRSDYNGLMSTVNTSNYFNVAGNDSGHIPLSIKMSIEESSFSTIIGNTGVVTSGGNTAINIRRTFPDTNAYTEVSLDFQNSKTEQPIYLTNVALSAFDIDYANSSWNNRFDDFVIITGVNEAGDTISGSAQNISGSNLRYSSSSRGFYTSSTYNCPAKDFGTSCQASIQFPEPVKSVKVRYTNTGRLSTSTNQEIDFRVDNYCYVPEYTFSGTVFNDNAGLSLTADDIDSIDNDYFNGIFDSSESGISHDELQVSLTNCSADNTLIETNSPNPQTVSNSGQYSFEVSSSAVDSKVCLVQSEPSEWQYNIDSTPNSREVTLRDDTYTYSNVDFGEVTTNNAPLVLKKAQYVHNCDANLDYSSATINQTTDDPTTGFSIDPVQDVDPDQCIAYRIIAYNRGHVELGDVRIVDTLQSPKSIFSSPLPASSPNDLYTSDSLPDTDTITSNLFNLAAAGNKATQATLYFNTKYDTTQ
ncbi:hypothetical protein [Psychrobacter sp.]|uniref:hypothetical protein n=1 Tax=Psychrobacter sp. TaxID=56811 RepID=UPI003F98EE36